MQHSLAVVILLIMFYVPSRALYSVLWLCYGESAYKKNDDDSSDKQHLPLYDVVRECEQMAKGSQMGQEVRELIGEL